MTAEGKELYRLDVNIRHEEQDCARCEKHRDYLLQYSPVIRFLNKNISQLGGELNSNNIICRRCVHRHTGGFDHNYGIKLCANEFRNRGHLEDTLAHEMIHAHDYLRFEMDPRNNLRHAACTEVGLSFACNVKD